jgi:hypothetical protein
VNPDSLYMARLVFAESVESVDVLKRNTRQAFMHGPSGTAGGLIRVVMKRAARFPFPEL